MDFLESVGINKGTGVRVESGDKEAESDDQVDDMPDAKGDDHDVGDVYGGD